MNINLSSSFNDEFFEVLLTTPRGESVPILQITKEQRTNPQDILNIFRRTIPDKERSIEMVELKSCNVVMRHYSPQLFIPDHFSDHFS